MKSEILETRQGKLSICQLEDSETIKNTADFMDVIMNCPSNTVVLEKDHLAEEFYDLKTRLAGDCLQKVSNYRKRLVILGDFTSHKSKSLHDFIRESNQYGQVIFSDSLDSAIDLLQ